MAGNNSEVQRLLSRIDAEYQAAHRSLTGPAVVASHQSITARSERIANLREELVGQVGGREAMRLIIEREVQRSR